MSRFFDPLIPRKSALIKEALEKHGNEGIPLPAVVEVSESGTCNRKCGFCPRSAPDYPDIKEFIDPDLLDKLARELGEVGFKGVFIFSGFVEPLLDANIYRHIQSVRNHLPNARIEIITNGDVLNFAREEQIPSKIAKIKKLLESGLSTLLISVYGDEEALKRSDYETVFKTGKEAALRFERLCKDARLSEDQYKIRHRYLPPEQDFGITLSNRGGTMQNAAYSIPNRGEVWEHPCFYPDYMFFMDYNGDVLMCSHDWGKKYVTGNMKHQSFEEIWLGERFQKARERLMRGDRYFSPCGVCDVDGTLMGKEHAEAWQKYMKMNAPKGA